MIINTELKQLLQTVSGITDDSRAVKPGHLFLAWCGERVDGRDYIAQAIEKGAAAIVYQAYSDQHAIDVGSLPTLAIDDLTQQLGEIAAEFYQHPSQKMSVVGITGTNGKTSVSHYVAQALSTLRNPCAVLGTVGTGFLPKLKSSAMFTTPSAIALQHTLAELLAQRAQTVAMEVSSHGLAQHRVNGVTFETAVFTNLTRDHLDYHGDMQSYAAAKELLFKFPKLKNAVINIDDDFGAELVQRYAQHYPVITYSLDNAEADIYVTQSDYTIDGITAQCVTPWGSGEIKLSLLGRFNLHNVLAVIGVLGLRDYSFAQIQQVCQKLHPVAGRMQVIRTLHKPTVVVDYAHTPDALAKALGELKPLCRGQLWVVFGCGGDRDPGKRPQMAAAAERFADQIVVTSDNSRHEPTEKIIQDIIAGFSHDAKVESNPDRAAAIAYAIQTAAADDVVLLAGKGHEDYQLLGDKKLSFSDIAVANESLNKH